MANYDFGTPIISPATNEGFTGVCDTGAVISGTESFAPTQGSYWRIDTGTTASATSYTSGSTFAQDFHSHTPPATTYWNLDDNSVELTPPFSITYDGVSYASFYLGTNAYLTFGGGSSVYSNLSAANPSLRKVMINAIDHYAYSYGTAVYDSSPNRVFMGYYSGRRYSGDTGDRLVYYFKMYEALDGIIDFYIERNDFRAPGSQFNNGTSTAFNSSHVSGVPTTVGNITFTPTSSIARVTSASVPRNFTDLITPTDVPARARPAQRPGGGQLYPRGVYNK